MGNLHVCNNDHLDESDRLAKVRPLFTDLTKRFLLHDAHCQNHSIDETVVPLFGKHEYKQKIHSRKEHQRTGIIREHMVGGCPLTNSNILKKTDRGISETKLNIYIYIYIYILQLLTRMIIGLWQLLQTVSQQIQYTKSAGTLKSKRIGYVSPNYTTFMFTTKIWVASTERIRTLACTEFQSVAKSGIYSLLTHCIDVAEQNDWQLHRQGYG
ncbi:hypothetical protein PR048_025174 [Dryococelus australis]|uniref:PiggyBac transposable element-derived protein domain-containing protein n=1 Tax=Dryococelus australis TaxID=614101 RepID=A0ABQ9GQQ6_9NEOP|nr:hypothetical protein PR048_025174 [Dryococelus australis]